MADVLTIEGLHAGYGDTVVLNPGAIYRASPHSIAVVDLPAVEASIIEL